MPERKLIKFYYWLIEKMPKELKLLTAIDIIAYATTGQYSNTVVRELTAMEAIKRFRNDHKL